MRTVLIYGMIAFIGTFLLMLLGMPLLAKGQAVQPINGEAPQHHQAKKGVLTLGGIFILSSTLILLVLTKHLPLLFGCTILSFGLIGFADDALKLISKHNAGLNSRYKLLATMAPALALTIASYFNLQDILINPNFNATQLHMITLKLLNSLSFGYIPFALLITTFTVHAVNLTDGIDGLCPTLSIIAFSALCALALSQGQRETAIICAVLAGSLGAFMHFNAHPAKIILGDTGSLAIGGAFVYVALDLNSPWALVLIGLVFLFEGFTVMIQVGYFKLTKKRIFKMAPYHHAMEINGKSEPQIVTELSLVACISTTLYFILFVR